MVADSQILNYDPDPDGKIFRDIEKFIRVEYVVVPSTDKSKNSWRTHMDFTPNKNIKAHWNNEVEGMKLWINPPSGWKVNHQSFVLNNPDQAVSSESRSFEFEITISKPAAAERVVIPVYALYYVCEDVNGVCLCRRQDIPIQLNSGQ